MEVGRRWSPASAVFLDSLPASLLAVYVCACAGLPVAASKVRSLPLTLSLPTLSVRARVLSLPSTLLWGR